MLNIKKLWNLIRLFIVTDNLFILSRGQNIIVALGTKIYPSKYISIGSNVFIGRNCTVSTSKVGGSEISIGNNVMIAEGVKIIGGNHAFDRTDISMFEQGEGLQSPIIINDDIWIGANSITLSGIEIGKGSVIGAGSVVTKSIPEYSIAVGNPARVIKKRK